MRERLERILSELEHRYGLDSAFLAAVRPLAGRILGPGMPDAARPELLTLLAETCARHVQLRRDSERTRQGLRDLFDRLARLLQQAWGLPETGLGPARE